MQAPLEGRQDGAESPARGQAYCGEIQLQFGRYQAFDGRVLPGFAGKGRLSLRAPGAAKAVILRSPPAKEEGLKPKAPGPPIKAPFNIVIFKQIEGERKKLLCR